MSSIPNMKELMEKAKEMQSQMQQAQQEITSIEVEGAAGGGLVKVFMNGAHQAKRVQISPTLLGDDDEDMLEDLVAAAINDASKKIEDLTKSKMMGIAKNMKLPDEFNQGGAGDAGAIN